MPHCPLIHSASIHLNYTLSTLSMLLRSFYKNLLLSLNTSTNNPACFYFPPCDSTTPAPTASSASLITRSASYFYDLSTYLFQPGPSNPLPSSINNNSSSYYIIFPPILCIHCPHPCPLWAELPFPSTTTMPQPIVFVPHIIPKK